jgi:GNAT superfamily N-acetyltransferase
MTHFMRVLREWEWPGYREHLLRLDAADRRLRFGFIIGDAGIDDHVRRLRPGADRILAVLHDFGRVAAAVHIAPVGDDAAELAFSVDRPWQNRGLGRALFERALSWLRSRGIRRVFLVYLSENGAMRTLARAFGMTSEAAAGEVTAELTLPPANPLIVLGELVADLAGDLAALWSPILPWPPTSWPPTSWPAPLWPAASPPAARWPASWWPAGWWSAAPWPPPPHPQRARTAPLPALHPAA